MSTKLSIEETITKLLDEPIEQRRARHAQVISTIEADVFGSKWFLNLELKVKSVYTSFPPWKFYVLKQCPTIPVRHMGVIEHKDISGKHILLNAVVNDSSVQLSPDDIVSVDEWSPEHIEAIKKSIAPAALLEPVGFMGKQF